MALDSFYIVKSKKFSIRVILWQLLLQCIAILPIPEYISLYVT